MLTQDDLQAIGELIKPLQADTITIKEDVKGLKSHIDLNNSVLRTIFKVELNTAIKDVAELATVTREGFEEIRKKLKEVKEEIHSERLKQIEEQLTKLEKQQAHSNS